MGRYIAGLLDSLAAMKPDGVRARPLFLPGAPTRGLRRVLKRLPFAYSLADAGRAAVLWRERPTVYHETNHAAPLFRGPVVLTVHDLSTVLYPQTQEPARARHFARKLRSARFAERVPTVAVRLAGHTPLQVAKFLGDRGIFTWDGNYYALNLTERLGIEKDGGLLRIGLVHYNTAEEVDRLLNALQEFSTSH